MRHFLKHTLLLLLVIICNSCSADDGSNNTNPDLINETSITEQILVLINQHRSNLGLENLSKNSTAIELAIQHTNYMINQQKISHDNFDDRAAVLQNEENATGWAENVASRYPTAESVVNGWLNSSGHKRNIEGNYTKTGIAAIKDSNGHYYFTQIFFRN